jgi:flagellar biosynthesis repressor protein FlbT
MSGRLKIHLKANERIFINGGVLKVDRKVSLELLNNVVFLLESHVMQAEDTTTPLRQLYFIVQSMLIEPKNAGLAMELFGEAYPKLLVAFKNQDVLEGLVEVNDLMTNGKPFEALKKIRGLLPIEQGLLAAASAPLLASPLFAGPPMAVVAGDAVA